MRELTAGTQNYTKIYVADKPGQGGECHKYYISRAEEPLGEFGHVGFQDEPVMERSQVYEIPRRKPTCFNRG